MGQKNSFCVLRVNDKMTEIRVQRARICALVRNRGTARYFYLSLSLCVCCARFLVAFRTSVRWRKRGLYCALCSLLKYSRDDCSRRERNFWLKNGIASRETPLSSVPLNNELQTSRLAVNLLKMHAMRFFFYPFFFFFFSFFPLLPILFFFLLSFSLTRLQVETSICHDCEQKFKEIVFRGRKSRVLNSSHENLGPSSCSQTETKI